MTRAIPINEVAELLAVSSETVEAWIAANELRAVNVSRDRASKKPRWRVLQSDLDAFLSIRATDTAHERQPRRSRIPAPRREWV